MTFADALRRLDARANYERARAPYAAGPGGYGTVRMARLLSRLGGPHRAIPALHVAGTKGKGSVTRLAALLLAARGLRTGEYLSPHVHSPLERIALAGTPITEDGFARAFAAVEEAALAVEAEDGDAPTWFETLTAMAFCAFREARLDAVVLEVGLGGRLDATNLPDLPALAAGIAPVSLDHQDLLGHTLGAIAGEKAGILRPGAAAAFGPQPPEAAQALETRAAALGIAPERVGRGYDARLAAPPPVDQPEAPQHLRIRTPGGAWPDPVPLSWPGRHQAGNAALALALADAFFAITGRPPMTPREAARAWGAAPPLPGRLEVLGRRPWVVADGAHNPASAAALARTVQERFSAARRTLVFASARDKDWRGMLDTLAPLAERGILSAFPSPRCQEAATVAAWLAGEGGFPAEGIEAIPDPGQALARALALMPPEGLVLVTGSFMLVGEAGRKMDNSVS